jgi:ABC-type multidrug transport system fused ATPase/permease subunit
MGVISGFKKLISLFNKRQKINSIIMLGLIALGGIAETVSIGVILPFTTVLLNQESVAQYSFLYNLTQIPWIGGYRRFIVLMCIGLVIVFILKSLYMFFLIYVQNRFTLNRQIEMSKILFGSYLFKPYDFFFDKNSAELQRNVNTLVSAVIQGVLMNGIQLLTEVMVVFFILALLLIADPISTITLGLVLGGVGALYYFVLKKRLDESAQNQNIYGSSMVKTVNEGLGSIKEVKILGTERSFLSEYKRVGAGYAKTTAFHNMVYQSPRLLIETVAISGLVIIVVINALRNPDMEASLPMIALFGMAAIRIMPSMNRIIGLLTNVRFNLTHFNQIYDDLKDAEKFFGFDDVEDAACESIAKMQFKDSIEINDLSYSYPGSDVLIFNGARLNVKKGQTIGVVGSSGAGKTTLIDLLLGLLEPQKGAILVDGVNIGENILGFRRSVGYVPQDIFLIDDSIAANVAFGVPRDKVDTARVWETLEVANLKEHIESLDNKLETNVGEGGTKLSGGQRQRLGIARALYNNPDILIFDEATSSLDSEGEKMISDAITAIGETKTMIIIAHRLNTLEKCDVIYEIRNKSIIKKS